MSVSDEKKIDGMAADGNTLVLMISDHLSWLYDEAEHLNILQKKFNTYLHFISAGAYESSFKNLSFDDFRIELVCLHKHPRSLDIMIEAVRPKLEELKTKIVCVDVGKGGLI